MCDASTVFVQDASLHASPRMSAGASPETVPVIPPSGGLLLCAGNTYNPINHSRRTGCLFFLFVVHNIHPGEVLSEGYFCF